MAFPTLSEYESLIYGLPDKHPEIVASTVRIYSTSALTAAVEGEIEFDSGLRLRVAEAIDFFSGRIRKYGYTVYRGEVRIRWYDPQPIPTTPRWPKPFRTTITNHRTLSIIAAPRLISASPRPIFPS